MDLSALVSSKGLLNRGFRNLRCLYADPGGGLREARQIWRSDRGNPRVEIVRGKPDFRGKICLRMAHGVTVVYHLAAARGEKILSGRVYEFPWVTTRNLLDACHHPWNCQTVRHAKFIFSLLQR